MSSEKSPPMEYPYYQVTITDKHNFIDGYRNFTLAEMDSMLNYIALNLAKLKTVNITSWDTNGERK